MSSKGLTIFASIILQRNPLILPKLSQFENDFSKYHFEYTRNLSKGEISFNGKENNISNTNIDHFFEDHHHHHHPDVRSTKDLKRMMDKTLYFIIKKDEWIFPTREAPLVPPTENGGLHQIATDLISEKNEIYQIGSAPIAVHKDDLKRTFFFRSQIISFPSMPIEGDYAFLTKEELKTTFTDSYYSSVKDVLS